MTESTGNILGESFWILSVGKQRSQVLVITVNGGNYCPMATETGHIHRLVYLLLTNENKDCNDNDVDQYSQVATTTVRVAIICSATW